MFAPDFCPLSAAGYLKVIFPQIQIPGHSDFPDCPDVCRIHSTMNAKY